MGSKVSKQQEPRNERPKRLDNAIIRQFVEKVTKYSSQYDTTHWRASCLEGPPSVFPSYGDIPGTWAQGDRDNKQFVELEYREAIYITGIDIYETYHAGGVIAVKALDKGGNWQVLWITSKPETITSARVFSPPLTSLDFKTNRVRIDVDCTACSSWVEIDAVQLHGSREKSSDVVTPNMASAQKPSENRKSQWVTLVTDFSSQYGENGWSANSVLGPPTVYPRYGDISGAWAPKDLDTSQFLDLRFDEAVNISGVDIYETYHAGGVVAVLAMDDKFTWQTLWKTDKPSVIKDARIFSPALDLQNFKCKTRQLRLVIDCTAANSWVEIDAVQLHSSREKSSDVVTPNMASAQKLSENRKSQWVTLVTDFSSQYGENGWSANSVLGPPTVYPRYGDISGAWAPKDLDTSQFLDLRFDEAVNISGVDIYETYHAGGVVAVLAMDDKFTWQTLWKTDKPSVIKDARIFSPALDLQNFKCKTRQLRLVIDCTAANSWVEIDAVQLHSSSEQSDVENPHVIPQNVPAPPVETDNILSQWVGRVTKFSSQYNDLGWSANCVIGIPKVYPAYGDTPGTWAPGDKNNSQFLELEFKEAVFVSSIDIFETFNAGGVIKIHGLDDKMVWQVLWKAEKPTDIKSSRVFNPNLNLKVLNCPTKNIRLDVDCTAADTWVEIDAVQLHGTKHLADSASNQRDLSSLSSDFPVRDEPGLVLNDKDNSDCQFLVEGKDVIYAHIDILSSRSDYFKELFSVHSQLPSARDKIKKEITDVSYTGFMGVLHYIYHFQLPEVYSCVMLTDVWRAADRFRMQGLKSDTEKAITQNTDVNSVMDVHKAATETYPVIEPVSNYCEQYMKEHMQEIVNAPSFTSFPHGVMAYPY